MRELCPTLCAGPTLSKSPRRGPFKLSTVRHSWLQGLFILGEVAQAEMLLSKFKWGRRLSVDEQGALQEHAGKQSQAR